MLDIEDFFKQKVKEEYHLDSKEYVQLSNFRITAQKAAMWTNEYLESKVNGAEQSTGNCNKPHVSGSFSDSDVKWVVYYGHTKDKRIFLDEEKSGLDYYLEDSFRRNETMKIFGEIFWNRIRKLVENYR